jgi:hypothetical protein
VQQLMGDPNQCGFEMMEPIRVQYIPDAETLTKITQQIEQNLDKYMEEK